MFYNLHVNASLYQAHVITKFILASCHSGAPIPPAL